MWAFGGPALAAGPARLTGEITDQAGALGARRGDVQGAIAQLYNLDRIKLYVVYVPDFDGLGPTTWLDDTTALSALGARDILLGVATSDRSYAISADSAIGLSKRQLDSISS